MAAKREITIEMNYDRPDRILFCDRYAIRKHGDFYDLDFLCLRSNRTLSVRVASELISSTRDSFIKYLNEAGIPETQAPEQAHFTPDALVVADIIALARHGSTGEFTFHAVSWKGALDGPAKEAKTIAGGSKGLGGAAFFVAMVRSHIDTQLHWIGALYNE